MEINNINISTTNEIQSLMREGKFKEAEKAYKSALANLKAVFPLEDALYMTDKYIVQTKVRKLKGSEYLAFDVKPIEE